MQDVAARDQDAEHNYGELSRQAHGRSLLFDRRGPLSLANVPAILLPDPPVHNSEARLDDSAQPTRTAAIAC
jgi:hypothetical protein